ncbi:MAG: FtsW/RodA/SpoVE family cell cycle protein [Flavobacteriales bacterium]|jgi:cell division protein FtsW|nr:FtsW/RodA/SpoVE family cell cycle protein [Flavobacteriales bacterium]
MQAIFNKIQGDKVIWMVTFLLSILSLLAVYSAISTLAFKAGGNSLGFLFKHLSMFGIGFVVMFVVHKINFKYFSRASQILIYAAAVLLVLTLVFGSNINDAKRWITIPVIGLSFQTSDLAKIVLITFLARQLNHYRTKLHEFNAGILPILAAPVVICGLILPANFSTAAMLFAVCFLMMFIGGVSIRHLFQIAGLGVAGLVAVFLVGKAVPGSFPRLDTWIHRIENFTEPNAEGNYQSDLAQVAIYRGGVIPSGPGSGSSRNYLPHPYSDMIYAFIIEEYGAIFGGLGVLFLYLILLYRSIRTATRCPKHFGGLLALGLSFLLVMQAIINMAVAVKLFPTTGQPLPLVSMGGTSIVFTCLAIGMILSVSRSVYNTEEWEQENADSPIDSDINSPAHAS